MQVLELMRKVRERLEAVMNIVYEEASVYDTVDTLIVELNTVERICEKLPEYEQSDVIDAYLGKMEETNEP